MKDLEMTAAAHGASPIRSANVVKQTLAKRLVGARKHFGLSQKDWAAELGVSAQYICDLEHGRRLGSVEIVNAICKLTRCSSKERTSWHRAAARAHGWEV